MIHAFNAKVPPIRIAYLVINLFIFFIKPVFLNVLCKIIMLLKFQLKSALNVMILVFRAEVLLVRNVYLVICHYIFFITLVIPNVLSKIIILLKFLLKHALNVMIHAFNAVVLPIRIVSLVINLFIFFLTPVFLNVLSKIFTQLNFLLKNAINAMVHA
jgi:hypothetical protein